MSKVHINTDRNKYKLRWSYKSKRYSLSIGSISKDTLKAAKAKAALIESDILFDRFDTTLAKYSAKYQKTDNLLGVWERYKELNHKRVEITTQQECWSQVDRCLLKAPQSLMPLDKSDELIQYLLNHYSSGTLKRVLIDINAAVNSIKGCKYYKSAKLPKTSKKPIECFNDTEVKVIIEAFTTNRYQSPYSQYPHDYYANYVGFLAYTGCRPSEAIALTWSDITDSEATIRFDKAYSKGILKQTKNYSVRDFPINEQLETVLDKSDSDHLVFSSVTGSYINHKTWSKRYWKPVINGLVNDNQVTKYLKPYCLRHSFITRCIRAGYDVATVAKLAGTSSEMIFRNYLASQDTTNLYLPEI